MTWLTWLKEYWWPLLLAIILLMCLFSMFGAAGQIVAQWAYGSVINPARGTTTVVPAEDCERWYVLGEPPVPFNSSGLSLPRADRVNAMAAEAAAHTAYNVRYLACRERNRRP